MRGVVQRHVEGIVDDRVVALDADVAGHGMRQAEQRDGLVDEVGAEVEQDPRARFRTLAPHAAKLRAIAFEAGFEKHDPAARLLLQQPLDGEEIAVPPPIVEDGEQAAAAACDLDDGGGFRRRRRERFVDDDVAAGLEAAPREVCVRGVRRRDDDQPDCLVLEQFVHRTHDACAGMERPGTVAAALNDRGEAQAGDALDHRGMEDAAGHAEADQADKDVVGGRGHRSAECTTE